MRNNNFERHPSNWRTHGPGVSRPVNHYSTTTHTRSSSHHHLCSGASRVEHICEFGKSWCTFLGAKQGIFYNTPPAHLTIWWQNADYNQIKTSPSCGTAGATQFGERDRAAERQILISRCPCISLIKIWYEHASIPLNQGCETHFCHRRQFTVTLEGPLWLWNTCLITCLYYYIYSTQLID